MSGDAPAYTQRHIFEHLVAFAEIRNIVSILVLVGDGEDCICLGATGVEYH